MSAAAAAEVVALYDALYVSAGLIVDVVLIINSSIRFTGSRCSLAAAGMIPLYLQTYS